MCNTNQTESEGVLSVWDSVAPIPKQPITSNKNNMKEEELEKIANLITANIINTHKEVLTSDEAARYMGVSRSYLYKLTMRREIPHYKPMGKIVYFNRLELEQWLQSNRCATDGELSQQAQSYCMRKGGAR